VHSLRKKFDENYNRDRLRKERDYAKKLIMEESILKKMVKKPEEKKQELSGLKKID